jgi:hypothetical protein
MGREVSDAALIDRQRALQREAAAFMSDLRIEQTLSRLGPVLGVGSAFTGLMVWRDLDLVVDAGDATASVAFEAMQPLLGRCRETRYELTLNPRRHYFVGMRLARGRLSGGPSFPSAAATRYARRREPPRASRSTGGRPRRRDTPRIRTNRPLPRRPPLRRVRVSRRGHEPDV